MDLLQLEASTGEAVSTTRSVTVTTLIYPFSMTHLSTSGATYTLYTESASSRQDWIERIMEAKVARAHEMSKLEPFQIQIIAESAFGVQSMRNQAKKGSPPLVKYSTMSRALVALRTKSDQSQPLAVVTDARVTCAKSFIAPENVDNPHQRWVAVGTDDGVYIGNSPVRDGHYTVWKKVLNLPRVTQIDVLEEFGFLLVLAKKELVVYNLASVFGQSEANGELLRLSGTASVDFFATGILQNRMLVLFKKRSGSTSIFKALEPVNRQPDAPRRSISRYLVFGRRLAKQDFFREYDVHCMFKQS